MIARADIGPWSTVARIAAGYRKFEDARQERGPSPICLATASRA
jgi:hypothetical protein